VEPKKRLYAGLPQKKATVKRVFDVVLSAIGIVIFMPLIVITVLLSTLSCKAFGIFRQIRIGLNGKPFTIYKIRTMSSLKSNSTSTVTIKNDPRITPVGHFLRKYKIDELPQLWNVLRGDMSFVGPRPDVPGFADRLSDQDQSVLSIRPGITGPATLKYRAEEQMLATVEHPERYNSEVIFPDKVRINQEYIENWSLKTDFIIIFRTVFHREIAQ